MRALVVEDFGPYTSHRLHEMPVPEPRPGEVVIETKAMSVNFPDVLMVEGRYQHKPERPFIPGFDAAGVVVATGAGIERPAVGARVLTNMHTGAFAEFIRRPAAHVHEMPDGMAFTEAAAFPTVYATAYVSMTVNGGAQAGERVLITGASGGVGLAMVQYAKAEGLTVLAGVTSAQKAALVRAHGADHAILFGEDMRDAVKAQVLQATGGEAVDLVMDQVGGDVFHAAIRALRLGGRMCVVGFASGEIPEVKVNYLLMKKIALIGSPLSRGHKGKSGADILGEAIRHTMKHYEAGRLKPYISATLPFDDWQEAFRRLASRAVTGKIVLVP